MCNEVIFQVIIAVFQMGLLTYQIILAVKSYIHEISDKKGYFELTETNILCAKELLENNKDTYDLNKKIKLRNIGSDDLFLIQEEIFINDELHSMHKCVDVFYGHEGRFNIALTDLDLKKHHFELKDLDISIIFYLKNSKGYKYKQEINLSLTKIDESRWRLIKYNSRIK